MTTTFPTDNRTTLHECDSTAGWTATDGPTLFTAAPDPIEDTGCLAMQVSNETQNAYASITSDDYSLGGTLSVWIQDRAEFELQANVGIGMVVGDGTNRVAYAVGGRDGTGFRHDDGPVKWVCFLLDVANPPTDTVVLAGVEANLDLTAITQAGVYFETVVKSVGGADNVFWDIARFADVGDDVIMQGGTTSGAAGNGAQAAVVDRNTGSTNAYGVIRELATGVYGIQGNLTIGNSASATDQYWAESNGTYAWEDRGLSRPNYYRFALVGRTGQTSSIIFTSYTFSVPLATNASFDGNGADLDVVTMAACTFIGFNVGIDTSDDTGDDWTNCTYISCGTIIANGCDISGSTISEHANVRIQEGQDETNYDNSPVAEGIFVGGTGHAATDVLTLTDGSTITVDAVSSGVVTEFTVTTSGLGPVTSSTIILQLSSDGSGVDFTLSPGGDNIRLGGGSIYYDEATDPNGELDDLTITGTAFDEHAIVFGPAVDSSLTSITLTGASFNAYGSTDDVNDSTVAFLATSGSLTLNLIDCLVDGVSPVASGGGQNFSVDDTAGITVTVVVSPVTLQITVLDKNTLAPIQNVQTSIHTNDVAFTELMNEDTNASGIASEQYSGATPQSIVWRCRKSDDLDNPRYKAGSGIDTITTDGFTLQVLLEPNPVLN